MNSGQPELGFTAGHRILFHSLHISILPGYYTTETDTYDIKWTTPHCVLVLRLIGLTFDICDTHAFKNGAPKKEMDYYGIDKIPNLLEIASFVYFPASFLAGPQFPYHLFERFMNKEFAQYVSPFNCFHYQLHDITTSAQIKFIIGRMQITHPHTLLITLHKHNQKRLVRSFMFTTYVRCTTKSTADNREPVRVEL